MRSSRCLTYSWRSRSLRFSGQSLFRLPGFWRCRVSGWVGYARLVRAQMMAVKEREFVEAARALGASDPPAFSFAYILHQHCAAAAGPDFAIGMATARCWRRLHSSFLPLRHSRAHAKLGRHAQRRALAPVRCAPRRRLPGHRRCAGGVVVQLHRRRAARLPRSADEVEHRHVTRPAGMELTIGVIADTHGLLRPEALAALMGVDHITWATWVPPQSWTGCGPLPADSDPWKCRYVGTLCGASGNRGCGTRWPTVLSGARSRRSRHRSVRGRRRRSHQRPLAPRQGRGARRRALSESRQRRPVPLRSPGDLGEDHGVQLACFDRMVPL